MYLSGETSVFGIIGNPVSHSFSPAMQTIAFQQCNYNAVYVPFLVTKENLSKVLTSLEILNVKGINVTAPYKRDIIPYLDEISEEAQILDTVNSIHFDNGVWKGYNTDGLGFIEGLKEINYDPKKITVQMIGAGGAAQAIIYSLAKSRVNTIYIENRTYAKVHYTIKKYTKLFPDVKFIGGNCPKKFHLLVNTTPVGKDAFSLSVPLEIINNSEIVVDIIYHAETALIKKAQELHKIVLDGIPMLLHQGALAFEIWTKQTAPIAIMKKCLEQLLGRKN